MLHSGRLYSLFVGGFNGSASDTVDIFSAKTGNFSACKLSSARDSISSASVGRFSVNVRGVFSNSSVSSSVNIFDSDQ